MTKKTILFEIEKSYIPDLTWTLSSEAQNIYYSPISLPPEISDLSQLEDSDHNFYRKVDGIGSNILNIRLKNDTSMNISLANSDNTPELIAQKLYQQDYIYYKNGLEYPWSKTLNGSDLILTASYPAGGGNVEGSLDFFSREGNIEGSVVKTREGVTSQTKARERLRMTIPDFHLNDDNFDNMLAVAHKVYAPLWAQCHNGNVWPNVYPGREKWRTGVTYTRNVSYVWVLSTDLNVNGAYMCTTNHTSTLTNQPGLPGGASLWTKIPYSISFSNPIINWKVRDNNFNIEIDMNYILPLQYVFQINPYFNWTNSEYRKSSKINYQNAIIAGIKSKCVYVGTGTPHWKLWDTRTGYTSNYWAIYSFPNPTTLTNYPNSGPVMTFDLLYDDLIDTLNPQGYWANEGVNAFQETTSFGLITDPIEVLQEGADGSVDGVYEQVTISIDSYSTNWRTFEKNGSTLFVRLPEGLDPSDYQWRTELKKLFSNIEGYYNPEGLEAQFYEGRLISIPNISYKKDSTYYSLVSFDGGNIVLNNTDGFFDNLDEEDVYGQICTLRYSDGGTFQTIYTGYFESFQLNGIPGQLIANVYDKRKVFSNKMPNNYFRIEDYPYLNESNDGLPIPVGFGKINKAAAICLNETEQVSVDPIVLPDYYTFKICDDTLGPIQSVDLVFVEGVEVTPLNIDLTTCTFQLPSTIYVPGKFVSVSYHGYVVDSELLQNPIKVLEHILENYAGIQKNSFNYNLTEWNAARDKVGIPNIGLHIAENKSMIDIIGEISNSVFGTFLIQKDGLITFKIRDVTLDPIAIIRVDDQIEAPIQNYRSDEYANSIRVGHSKAWSNGKSSWVTIDDQEEALFNRYRVNAGKEVSTLLSSKADAITYGDSLYLQYAGIFPTFTIRTKTKFLNLALEDIIDVEVYILPDGSFGTVRLEVLGVDADLNSNIVTITGRYVSMGGTYLGKKLIKYLARS